MNKDPYDVGTSSTKSTITSPTFEHRLSVFTCCRAFDNNWLCHAFCICGHHRVFYAKDEEAIRIFLANQTNYSRFPHENRYQHLNERVDL